MSTILLVSGMILNFIAIVIQYIYGPQTIVIKADGGSLDNGIQENPNEKFWVYVQKQRKIKKIVLTLMLFGLLFIFIGTFI